MEGTSGTSSNRSLVLAMEGTSGTRTLCEDWDEYFMTLALLTAKQSTNPYAPVGVCIVNDKKEIVSTAYNGTLRDCRDNKFDWYRGPKEDLSDEALYKLYVPHAEVSALWKRTPSDFKNCTMYVTLFPCKKCTRMIIDSGIKTVIYLHDKMNYKSINSKMMFKKADVTYRSANKKLEIHFSDWNETNQLLQIPIREDSNMQMEVDEVENTISNI